MGQCTWHVWSISKKSYSVLVGKLQRRGPLGRPRRKWEKTDNVHTTWHSGTFVQLLLYWKSNKNYIFWVWVCSLTYPECNAHAPYCHVACPALQFLYNLSPKRHDFNTHTHTHTHIYMCVCVYIYICVCVCVCVCIYIYIYIYIYI